jgi:hypothetical protein
MKIQELQQDLLKEFDSDIESEQVIRSLEQEVYDHNEDVEEAFATGN